MVAIGFFRAPAQKNTAIGNLYLSPYRSRGHSILVVFRRKAPISFSVNLKSVIPMDQEAYCILVPTQKTSPRCPRNLAGPKFRPMPRNL